MEDRHLSTRVRRDRRELGSDVAPANQQNAARQAFHRQEGFIVDDVFFAGQAQRHRIGPARDENVPADQRLPVHAKTVRAGEPGLPVVGVDISIPVAALLLFRHWIGKGALESHQLAPVDAGITHDALAAHPPGIIDDYGPAPQHFLGIAAT